MKELFGIPAETILDRAKIKIFDGIAGSAKSSNIDRFLKERGITYGRFTSTNKLKRDAERRFGGHVDTIAGGLFTTVNGVFFADLKDVKFGAVVIDEVLQSDPRVLNAAAELVGRVNIIMCTDTRQMLAPTFGESFLHRFEEFCKREDVIYIHLLKTYRSRTNVSEMYYHKCYNSVELQKNVFRKDKQNFRTIKLDEMPYTHNDIYICHTNEIEAELYARFNVSNDYNADLIPKGMIARKEIKDATRYPILCQRDVEGKQLGYLQPSNVGTPTRYQGSEVEEGRTLYFLIEPKSYVGNREWYTVISRCYNIDSVVIVICNIRHQENLTEYNGRPVKKSKFMTVTNDVTFEDGTTLRERADASADVVELSPEEFTAISKTFEDTNEIHYDKNNFYFNGKRVTIRTDEKRENGNPKDVSITSLLNKEPDFDFNFMPDFMRAYERAQKDFFGSMIQDALTAPTVNSNAGDRGRTQYTYGLDLRAAYPTVLNTALLPTGGRFVPRDENREPAPDMFHWYIGLTGGGAGIFTEETKQRAEELNDGLFFYMGATTCKHGSRMGSRLYEMSHKSVETNEKRKGVHYGLLARSYLYGIDFKDSKPQAYAINERANHQLLMLAIRAKLDAVMYDIKKTVYGNPFDMQTRGLLNVDCLYFDYSGDIVGLGDKIAAAVPGYEFRIFKNGKEDKHGELLYKNYEDLKTNADLKRAADRERLRRKRARV